MTTYSGDINFLSYVDSEEDVLKYLHNTDSEDIALKIMREGFKFESRLDYTTDLVSGKDIVQLEYFKLIRKKYGTYTIVIHIGKAVVDYYNNLLKNSSYYFYEAISQIETELSSDGEPIYVLHPQFIKGYYNLITKTTVNNPAFNPTFLNPDFEKNVENLIKKSEG